MTASIETLVRAPRRDEMPRVWELLRALAVYEKLEHELKGSVEALTGHLFAAPPLLECRVAERAGRLIGYALFYPTYSSFHTRSRMWLEDLFVEPDARGTGAGRALLAEVARVSLARGCARLGWEVLDWNAPSIEFYERMGATRMNPDWFTYGLSHDRMLSLAEAASD